MSENKEKTMTVREFVNKYNSLQSDATKEALINSVIKRHYAPILEKKAVLETAFERSIQEKDGIKYVDSVLSQIGLFCSILTLYTTLDYKHNKDDGDNGSIFEDYDLLMENGVYPIIMYKIGEQDIKELLKVYSSVEGTFVNQQTFEAYLAKQVTRFGELFGALAGSGLESLSKVLEDEEKMEQAIGKLPKLDNIESILKLLSNK